VHCDESTSLGTTVLAAIGIGAFATINEAIKTMVHTASTFRPNVANREKYDKFFRMYNDLNKRIFFQNNNQVYKTGEYYYE
jgi:ribulose kinase